MTSEERFNRIEHILDRVVDTQLQVDATMLTLSESHIKTQEELQRLAIEARAFQAEMQELKRQFQAYLNTRPQ